MSQYVLDARTANDHFPGIGRYVVNLAQALQDLAPHIPLSLLCPPSQNSMRQKPPTIARINSDVSPFSLKQQWAIPAQLRDAKATLYHSPYYLMPYWPGVPTVLTSYDLIPLIYPEYFSATKRLIYKLSHHLALKTAHSILTISTTSKNDLLRYFRLSPERITVTPLAANPGFRPQSPEQITLTRKKYHLPETYVLYFGSNKPHKNLETLVKAWQSLPQTSATTSCKLVIAGHWDNRHNEVKQLVETLGLKASVLFIGAVNEENLPALYSGADIFVFPSKYEGFGLPVIEAMACGTPVICSDASSLSEVSGDAAQLIPPNDIEAWSQALARVMADAELRQQMRADGRQQAAKFSWQRVAQETLSVYEKIAADT